MVSKITWRDEKKFTKSLLKKMINCTDNKEEDNDV
jgi:hypothetical protein